MEKLKHATTAVLAKRAKRTFVLLSNFHWTSNSIFVWNQQAMQTFLQHLWCHTSCKKCKMYVNVKKKTCTKAAEVQFWGWTYDTSDEFEYTHSNSSDKLWLFACILVIIFRFYHWFKPICFHRRSGPHLDAWPWLWPLRKSAGTGERLLRHLLGALHQTPEREALHYRPGFQRAAVSGYSCRRQWCAHRRSAVRGSQVACQWRVPSTDVIPAPQQSVVPYR